MHLHGIGRSRCVRFTRGAIATTVLSRGVPETAAPVTLRTFRSVGGSFLRVRAGAQIGDRKYWGFYRSARINATEAAPTRSGL
jgi:hypothetical protein